MKFRYIIAISGGFDPLHIGHIRLMREAKKLGGWRNIFGLAKLYVILNSDDFLMQKKGYVFMTLEERKEILENIRGVDKVIISIDEDMSVCKTLEMVKPDIFANGGDRKNAEDIREKEICERLSIKMAFGIGGFDKPQSSSWLINKLKNLPSEGANKEGKQK